MTMNSSGPISLGGATAGQSINLENGFSATAQVSLNDTAVRNLAGVASGAITMPTNFYGKSNRANLSYTFSANTANASLNLSGISGYISGKSDITVTINSGVYLYSTSTGTAGLTLSGSTTGDTLTIVNNGYIMGQGGDGSATNTTHDGCGGWTWGGLIPPTSGGTALSISGIGLSSCTINNTNASAYIGGGGGGGGAGDGGGGRGGGGAGGGTGGYFTGVYNQAGGAGGGLGSSGGNGTSNYFGSGGGGGRIFSGTGGAGGTKATGNAYGRGGGSGGGGATFTNSLYGGNAGAGGSANAAGSAGQSGTNAGGGGGGWGASGGLGYITNTSYSGAAGGKAVNTGGKSITWTSGNTTRVYGAVS